MKYRHRFIEHKLKRYKDVLPALLVQGARQSGKSTLLKECLGGDVKQVVFDPVIDIGNARQDPEFFLDQYPPPVFLDEVQYAPELLTVIKRRIDEHPQPGQYFLSGSQNPAVLRDVSESLAGRVMVLDLPFMSLAERSDSGETCTTPWTADLFSPNPAESLRARTRVPARKIEPTVFTRLWRGGFPGVMEMANDILPDFFASYVRTYVERDIRRLGEVNDEQLFSRFVALCAALTAQEVNHSQLGRELGVTPQTAKRWLAILRATYQWLEIPAYHGNTIKRISARPKGYLADTGLAAWLQRISSPDALSGHPLQGALFETHAVLEILKSMQLTSPAPQVYHWRTHAGAEVDLLLELDGTFVPIEIKSKARVRSGDARGIRAFRETYPNLKHGYGAVVAAVEEVSALPDSIVVLPYDLV